MRPTFIVASALWLSVGLSLPASGQPNADRPLDVVLVLDNSGSMKQNDPGALMREAVSDFARQLPRTARLGIVIFDQDVDIALGLSATAEPDFNTRVEKSLEGVDYSGRWTDIAAGVERALYELRRAGRADANRVVVFFTDGIVDVGDAAKNLDRARWLRDDLAQSAKRLGVRVFGIAFTEAADFQLIQSVAQTSGGEYFRVLAADEIPAVFRQIIEQIQRPIAVAAAAVPPAPPAAQEGATPRLWVGGAVAMVIGAVALIAWRRRSARAARPSVEASLRDLSGRSGVERTPLDKALTRIGRTEDNDIVIEQETVSSQHAVIEFREGAFHLRDLRSANGTFVNGSRFSDPHAVREVALKHRDRIRFDAYEFEFIADALEDVAQTQLAAGASGTPGATRLRADLSPPIAQPSDRELVPELPPLPVRDDGAEAKTRLKPDMCPNHPAWKATELCSECKRAVCRNCLVERSGQKRCLACAKGPAA